jgi:hypothetical protein
MKKTLLDLLVCPICHAPLHTDSASGDLVCRPERLAYPVMDGIPMLLAEHARPWLATDGP